MRRSQGLAAVFLGVAAFQARALSLTDLLASMPPPPAEVPAAVAWIRDGQIVAPEYLRFKQALVTEHAAIAALNGGTEPVLEPVPGVPPGDAPEVQVLAREYDEYLQGHSGDDAPQNAIKKRTRWLQGVMGKRLVAVTQAITPCPDPCTDAAVAAKNAPVLAQRDVLAREDLKYWTVLSGAWASERKPLLVRAEASLAATGEGAKATTPEGRSAIVRYRAAMLREIEVALSVTELAVRRAWSIQTGQVDAISSASRNAKK
jgi:hypothetical protein